MNPLEREKNLFKKSRASERDELKNTWLQETQVLISKVGIQIRNMKMVFNIYGTWRWVTFEKLMMKIYVFFLFG